nr:hypothetical protein [Tanacetum cinerariifolium]
LRRAPAPLLLRRCCAAAAPAAPAASARAGASLPAAQRGSHPRR